MNPGHKIICIESGSIAFTDSYGDSEILPPVPELTIGKVYTVEKIIPANDSFSFTRVVLVEEKGQSKAAYHAGRFDLYGM
jgi:hypothetical protein